MMRRNNVFVCMFTVLLLLSACVCLHVYCAVCYCLHVFVCMFTVLLLLSACVCLHVYCAVVIVCMCLFACLLCCCYCLHVCIRDFFFFFLD